MLVRTSNRLADRPVVFAGRDMERSLAAPGQGHPTADQYEEVVVTCPAGAAPGVRLKLTHRDQEYDITLPDGARPGHKFSVRVPALGPAPQTAAVSAGAPPAPSPLPPAMRATGFPEWKCQTAMAQSNNDATLAINFLYHHMDKPDEWWQSFRAAGPLEGDPPASAGAVPGGGAPSASAGGVPPVELSASVQALIRKSEVFDSSLAYRRHPLETQRVATLVMNPPAGVGREEFARQMDQHIAGVHPIADARLQDLLDEFLQIKRAIGCPIEKQVYATIDGSGLLDRLLQRRPLVFCEQADAFLLRSGQQGRGGFDAIGTGADTGAGPLTLRELLSYDEMCLSALVGMSVPTHFINEGGRRNNGTVGAPASYTKRGILTGLAGARFERPGKMEWQHMYITREQNTVANGYGPRGRGQQHDNPLLEMWARFYGLTHLPTYDEVVHDVSAGAAGVYCEVRQGNFLNIHVYKERMRAVLLPFLLDAQDRAHDEGKEAYCHVVGLGLGVWMVTEEQGVYLVDVVGELLANHELADIGTVDFSWFPPACAERGCNGARHNQTANCAGNHNVRIRFSRRDPAAKLSASDCVDPFKEPLLVAMYAWDSNSFPGNEYWLAPTQGKGVLSASGDPAAAACSTIAELQNPDINPERVCAAAMKWYGQAAPVPIPASAAPSGGAAYGAAGVDVHALYADQVGWQHAAIDAARDHNWERLQTLILMPGAEGHLMPDALLNGIPTPRGFNVLHQMAMGDQEGTVLQRFIAAGCRFDTAVRSMPHAREIEVVVHGQSRKVPGANLTAHEIANLFGFQGFLQVLATIPPMAAGLAKTQSVKASSGGPSGGYGGAPYAQDW